MNIEPTWLDERDIIAIHSEIIQFSGGSTGVLNQNSLLSTLNKPKNLYFYQNTTIFELAACYGYGLAKNHCFVDGNKRIALIAIYTFLSVNGFELIASEIEATQCFLDLAATVDSQEESIQKLAKWIEGNCQPN
jgi:death-on-curing protein